MTQGARTERVGEEFREVLAEHIQRLKDPRVGFITVTGVKVTPDLKRAMVYYTSLGDDRARAASRAALRSATPHLRAVLGREVRLKYLPELSFEEDVTPRASRADRGAVGRAPPGGEVIELDRAAAVLAEAPEVALACHVNPDADALGSMLGLAGFLRDRGHGDHSQLPERSPGAPALGGPPARVGTARPSRRLPEGPAVMVTCDCASFDRLAMFGRSRHARR